MSVKQISVFIENKQGRLVAVTSCLAAKGVNILALAAADTTDYGILRLIVDQPQAAYRALKEANFTVRETEVLAAEVDDAPGGLNRMLKVLEEERINVEYIYSFFGNRVSRALNILKVDDAERAAVALEQAGFRLLSAEEVYAR